MTLVVESTSTATANDSASITVTKPTGVVSGDLLVIVGSGISTSVGACSGFTAGVTKSQDNPGSIQDASIVLLYKVADSSDVSASNYTYTIPSAPLGHGVVSMFRISGWTSGNPIYTYATSGGSVDAASYSSGASGLTLTRPYNSLLIQGHIQQSKENPASYATYTVTSGGSNPTWTEVQDASIVTQGSLRDVAMAVAYANDSNTYNITAYSAAVTSSTAGEADGYASFLAVIVEPYSPSAGTPNLGEASPTFFTVTGLVGGTAQVAVATFSPSFFGVTATGITRTVWTAKTKSSTTWTANSK